jgi:hypothetical protein
MTTNTTQAGITGIKGFTTDVAVTGTNNGLYVYNGAELVVGTSQNPDTAGNWKAYFRANGTHPGIAVTTTTAAGVAISCFNSGGSTSPTTSTSWINFGDTGPEGAADNGAIARLGNGVNYFSASDYRLKENIQTLTNGLSLVKQLRPVTYSWVRCPEEGIFDGFIAHEAAEVVPKSVGGNKDAVDESGNIKAQGMDYSKIVPVLTSAIKELSDMVDELKLEIAALKAR